MMTRRAFTLAGTAGLFSLSAMKGLGTTLTLKDETRIFFLADTHIRTTEVDALPGTKHSAKRLKHVLDMILSAERRPDVAVFLGDLTEHGLPEEMTRFREIIQPLRDAGIACRLLPGNHDNYAGVGDQLFKEELKASPVPGKVVTVIETPSVNLIGLDTPDMATQDGWWGRIDGAQLEWLKAYLKEHTGKKECFICCHHPLYLVPVPAGVNMFRSLTGWISGHRHIWFKEPQIEHNVPVVYVPGVVEEHDGYVEMLPEAGRSAFTHFTKDRGHPKNGESFIVKSRTKK